MNSSSCIAKLPVDDADDSGVGMVNSGCCITSCIARKPVDDADDVGCCLPGCLWIMPMMQGW